MTAAALQPKRRKLRNGETSFVTLSSSRRPGVRLLIGKALMVQLGNPSHLQAWITTGPDLLWLKPGTGVPALLCHPNHGAGVLSVGRLFDRHGVVDSNRRLTATLVQGMLVCGPLRDEGLP